VTWAARTGLFKLPRPGFFRPGPGDVLNIYLDLIPDDEYQRRQQRMNEPSNNLF
jgi:hypothetical protein